MIFVFGDETQGLAEILLMKPFEHGYPIRPLLVSTVIALHEQVVQAIDL